MVGEGKGLEREMGWVARWLMLCRRDTHTVENWSAHRHTHALLYVYPTGDSVQTGDITNWGQSLIAGCVFKQMSPL